MRIPLDPSLSPSRNAQKYYKEYRKAQTAERVLAEQISRGRGGAALSRVGVRCASPVPLPRARWRSCALNWRTPGICGLAGDRERRPAPLGPLTYRSEDGYTILVGRNNQQNDQLTLRMAKGDDLWLHVRNIPGSHVIVLTGGATPPARTGWSRRLCLPPFTPPPPARHRCRWSTRLCGMCISRAAHAPAR